MSHPHLYSSNEPRSRWGVRIKALCGTEVPVAMWLAGVDTYSELSIECPGLCQNCKEKRLAMIREEMKNGSQSQLRWEYVISEGQEAIDAQKSA